MIPRLKAKLAFDETDSDKCSIELEETSFHADAASYRVGRNDEHDRLAPIHAALLAVIEAAEGRCTWSVGEQRYMGNSGLEQALAQLKRAIEGEK